MADGAPKVKDCKGLPTSMPDMPDDLPLTERHAVRVVVRDCEGRILLFNTRDVTDAYFGTLGVVVAPGFVALLKRRGLRPTKLSADGAAVADQS